MNYKKAVWKTVFLWSGAKTSTENGVFGRRAVNVLKAAVSFPAYHVGTNGNCSFGDITIDEIKRQILILVKEFFLRYNLYISFKVG